MSNTAPSPEPLRLFANYLDHGENARGAKVICFHYRYTPPGLAGGAVCLASEVPVVVVPAEKYDELVAAAREFIRKVDAGEAKSTRSYNAFKTALAL